MKQYNAKLPLFIFLILLCGNSVQLFAQSEQYITIGNNTAMVQNLVVVDSVGGPRNRVQHLISFDMTVSNDENTIALLNQYEQSVTANKILSLVITYVGTGAGRGAANNGDIAEERTYTTSLVREFKLNGLDASERNSLKVHIEIDGGATVAIKYLGGKFDFGKIKSTTARASLTSNFNLKLGTLETRRIVSIGSFLIGNSNLEKNTMSVTLSAADKKSWTDFFSDGAGRLIPDGSIELLGPDMRTVLLTINLKNIAITSYRSNSSNNDAIARATFTLKMGNISLSPNK